MKTDMKSVENTMRKKHLKLDLEIERGMGMALVENKVYGWILVSACLFP